MLDYKALDKEIDVILKSFNKEDLSLWLKLKLERIEEKDIPQIKFKGYTECLTTNPVAEYYHWYFNK